MFGSLDADAVSRLTAAARAPVAGASAACTRRHDRCASPAPLPSAMLAAATWDSWVWWGMGWTVAIGGAVAVLWALAWDRSRGRRRCPRCWYDMAGVEELTCPECGHVAPNERALRGARRRWAWGGAAALVAVFGWQLTESNRDAEGWTRIVPTRALKLAAVATHGWPEDPIRPIIFSREIGGSASAMRAWMSLSMDDAAAGRTVRTRARWPAGEPPTVEFGDVSVATPALSFWTIEASSRDRPEAPIRRLLHPPGTRISPLYWRPNTGDEELTLPARAPGRHRERLTVSITTDDGWKIGSWDVDVRYQVVPTWDEAVPPMDSPELREKIRSSLRVRESRSPERLSFSLAAGEHVPGLGSLHLKGEVLVDGKVITPLVNESFAIEPASSATLEPGVVPTTSGDARTFPADAVTLRITGDQRRALHDVDAEGYWSGTMELTLTELLRPWTK